MYDLIGYNDAYLKTWGSLQQNYRDDPALDDNGNITDFPNDNNNSILFKFKRQITGQTGNNRTRC